MVSSLFYGFVRRPYDDIGHIDVQHCTMPVDCNGTCPEQVDRKPQ